MPAFKAWRAKRKSLAGTVKSLGGKVRALGVFPRSTKALAREAFVLGQLPREELEWHKGAFSKAMLEYRERFARIQGNYRVKARGVRELAKKTKGSADKAKALKAIEKALEEDAVREIARSAGELESKGRVRDTALESLKERLGKLVEYGDLTPKEAWALLRRAEGEFETLRKEHLAALKREVRKGLLS